MKYRAVFAAFSPAVEVRVQARLERQGVLTKDAPLKLWAIVDEAALCRVVGGADVMQAQLLRLAEAAKTPNITFQVIPFGVEVAFVGGWIAMRDSKHPIGHVLVFTTGEWDAFVTGVEDGEFTRP